MRRVCVAGRIKLLVLCFIVFYVVFSCVFFLSVQNGTERLTVDFYKSLKYGRKVSKLRDEIEFRGNEKIPNLRGETGEGCDCGKSKVPWTFETVHVPNVTCPETPPNLVGKLGISENVTVEDVYNSTTLKHLHPGGSYQPLDCRARDRVAVIVPFRDRPRQVMLLIYHLHNLLQRQQLQYTIYVVEMAYPTQFNRGLLANVGFLTAASVANYTCYVIHDVDLMPADDRNLYRCANQPRHLSVNSSKYGYKLPYDHYNGGVVAFTREQFLRINGFSNSYFGWGKEDDDLHRRLLLASYKLDRPDPAIGVYFELPGTSDTSNPDNPMKDSVYIHSSRRSDKDGVRNVLYSRLALEFYPWYTWVYVSTNETLIMKRFKAMMFAKVDPDKIHRQ